jgi:hypothetical protein
MKSPAVKKNSMNPVTTITMGKAKTTVVEFGYALVMLYTGHAEPSGDCITLTAFTMLTLIIAGRSRTAVTNATVENTVRHATMLAIALIANIPVAKAPIEPQTPGIMNA